MLGRKKVLQVLNKMTENSALSAALVLKTKAVSSSEVKHKKVQHELKLEFKKKELNLHRTVRLC